MNESVGGKEGMGYSLDQHLYSQRPSRFPSTIMHNFHDQQIYLSITSTLLSMARQVGAPEEAIQAVCKSMMTARGLQKVNMLTNYNCPDLEEYNRPQSFNWLQRGIKRSDSTHLLTSLEAALRQQYDKENLIRCLFKFKREKSEDIAPSVSGGVSSRKERFRLALKRDPSKHEIKNSHFDRFQVGQIIQNNYHYQNQCYRTMCSFSHLKTLFGHSSDADLESYSQIFNAVIDRADQLIITGGEEGLIKVWHRASGSLVATLKAHTQFLNKIDTSPCNKYIMSSAGDGLRFFDLKTLKHLGGWKTNSIAEITSFLHEGQNYFLFGDNSNLHVLSEQVMLANSSGRLDESNFYSFYYGDLVDKDNRSILVISLSPNNSHLLLGLQSGIMLVLLLKDLLLMIKCHRRGNFNILPAIAVKAHHEQVIEMKWNQNNKVWATGAKDGRCCLWEFNNSQVQLQTTLTVKCKPSKGRKKRQSYSCTYICWNCTFSHFAAGFQQNVEEEDSDRGRGEVLVYSINSRKVTSQLSKDVSQEYGGIRAMDAHPLYPNILLICEADGHILLFDIFIGCIVNTFEERGYHILHPQFQLIPTQCHFTKDGLAFIVATQYGSISIYGYDSKYFFNGTPVEQFLHKDFQPFTIQDHSMKPLPLAASQVQNHLEDPRWEELLSVRMQKHAFWFQIRPEQLISRLEDNHPGSHKPQSTCCNNFLKTIVHYQKESQTHELVYSRTLEEVERIRQLVLFHQRERQFLTVLNIVNDKINSLQSNNNRYLQNSGTTKKHQQEAYSTRKLKRHSQSRRVHYVEDFQDPASEEQEYNADSLQNQQQEENFQDSSDHPNFVEQPRPRIISREARRNTRHQLRLFVDQEEEDQLASLPPRRRRDIFEEAFQLQNDYVPKKKVKVDEDSSGQKELSRLKKHINDIEQMSIEGSQCIRCQLTTATVSCHRCPYNQQFCAECAKLRGKRLKDHYICLICWFLHNKTAEEKQQLLEDCYRSVQKNPECYIPQLEDKVRFFFQGYEEFLTQNTSKLNPEVYNNNKHFRILPHTQDSTLLSCPECEILSIDYCFPLKAESQLSFKKRGPGKTEQLTIQMLIGLKNLTSGQVFWIYYWPGLQYLLQEQRYGQLFEGEGQTRAAYSVNQLVNYRGEQMQIVEIGPFEDRFPESVWKVVKLRKTQGKRLRGNTKQIQRRVNIWNIDQSYPSWGGSQISQYDTQLLLNQLALWVNQDDSKFCIFSDYVDFEIYPQYRQQVAVGMCMLTIQSRLKNHYYTGYHSLEQDIQLILNNSITFNGHQHLVTRNAQELCSTLLRLIAKGERVVVDHFQQQLYNSTTKKDLKMEQSLDLIEEEALVRGKEEKRRKRQSSEYQQSDHSQEYQDYVVLPRRTTTRNAFRDRSQPPKRVTRSGNKV